MKNIAELTGASLYFDSNVFINALESPDDALRLRLEVLFHAVSEQRCNASTSLITRAEVLVRPLRQQQTELVGRYQELLSGAGAVALYPLDEHIADRAAQLRADYPVLKLPDALHIATALRAGCDAFVTGDKRLGVVSAQIAVLGLDQLPSA